MRIKFLVTKSKLILDCDHRSGMCTIILACIYIYIYIYSGKCIGQLIKECRCYEEKIEESEKAGSHRESNPGNLRLPGV